MELTSTKAYLFSHILLRNKIFFDQKNFAEKLSKGPDIMKKYLSDMWNGINSSYFKEGVIVKDINREVSPDDFDIRFRNYNNRDIYFFILPDPDSFNAQAKATALLIDRTKGIIRYLTMEIWTERELEQKYTVGEWVIKEKEFAHLNKGRLKNNTLECFAAFVMQVE